MSDLTELLKKPELHKVLDENGKPSEVELSKKQQKRLRDQAEKVRKLGELHRSRRDTLTASLGVRRMKGGTTTAGIVRPPDGWAWFLHKARKAFGTSMFGVSLRAPLLIAKSRCLSPRSPPMAQVDGRLP